MTSKGQQWEEGRRRASRSATSFRGEQQGLRPLLKTVLVSRAFLPNEASLATLPLPNLFSSTANKCCRLMSPGSCKDRQATEWWWEELGRALSA